MKDSKQRLFEIMGRLDESFNPVNEPEELEVVTGEVEPIAEEDKHGVYPGGTLDGRDAWSVWRNNVLFKTYTDEKEANDKFAELTGSINEDSNDYSIGELDFYKVEHADGQRQPYMEYKIEFGQHTGRLKQVRGDVVEVEWDTVVPENWEEVDDVVNMNYADIVNNAPQI